MTAPNSSFARAGTGALFVYSDEEELGIDSWPWFYLFANSRCVVVRFRNVSTKKKKKVKKKEGHWVAILAWRCHWERPLGMWCKWQRRNAWKRYSREQPHIGTTTSTVNRLSTLSNRRLPPSPLIFHPICDWSWRCRSIAVVVWFIKPNTNQKDRNSNRGA